MSGKDHPDPSDEGQETPSRPAFQHPQWMLGVVLVFGVVAILAGSQNPVWWIIGAPCILTLLVWIWVRVRGPSGR